MNILFMGSPAFALPTLQALLHSSHNVVAVYSQPPRPKGRGQQLSPTPVHALAQTYSLPVLTPLTLKDAAIQAQMREFKADIAVVVAYGLLLPRAVLEMFPYGCINVHPSLLPRWRGAAPIERTLQAGDDRTGICIMQMEEGLDTGPVLLREELDIPPHCNAGQLHDLLSSRAPALVLSTLDAIKNQTVAPKLQFAEGITYAQKLRKEDRMIDWRQPATVVLQHILALAPAPGAQALFEGEYLKILDAQVEDLSATPTYPGGVLDDNLLIATGKGTIRILTLQAAGAKPLSARDFLRGKPIEKGKAFNAAL